MRGKIHVLKIKDLIFDLNFYPRFKTNWLTAYQYAMAMKAGSVFPPITVGVYKGKHYVIDGWHRVEALKTLGEEFVQAVIKKYPSEAEMFAESVRLNASHGLQLTPREKARIIDRLESYHFGLEQISEIVKVPVDKIARFKTKVVVGPNGQKIYIKSVVERAVKGDEKLALKVNQDSFNVRDVTFLLKQLLELLRSGVFPFDDPKVQELAMEVYSLLGEGLKLKMEA